jgi:hypothetical protein
MDLDPSAFESRHESPRNMPSQVGHQFSKTISLLVIPDNVSSVDFASDKSQYIPP